jgi:hypothetical protein
MKNLILFLLSLLIFSCDTAEIGSGYYLTFLVKDESRHFFGFNNITSNSSNIPIVNIQQSQQPDIYDINFAILLTDDLIYESIAKLAYHELSISNFSLYLNGSLFFLAENKKFPMYLNYSNTGDISYGLREFKDDRWGRTPFRFKISQKIFANFPDVFSVNFIMIYSFDGGENWFTVTGESTAYRNNRVPIWRALLSV